MTQAIYHDIPHVFIGSLNRQSTEREPWRTGAAGAYRLEALAQHHTPGVGTESDTEPPSGALDVAYSCTSLTVL